VAEDWLAQARTALEAGRADDARALADRAFRERPEDPQARELYVALRLAHAIQLSARAREMRREAIVRRDIPYDTEFEDEPEVAKAFDEAAAAVDEALAADPRSEKGLMMKASLLFRRDREKGRPVAVELLKQVVDANPANRQVLYEIRRIETPCKKCGDSGFCPRCRGRGSRRILRMASKCEACHGQGICLACGIL
jgi:tetratricopeptide (TPR) repeat protein